MCVSMDSTFIAILGCLLPPYNTLVDRYACMLTTEVLSLDAGFCFESASNDVAFGLTKWRYRAIMCNSYGLDANISFRGGIQLLTPQTQVPRHIFQGNKCYSSQRLHVALGEVPCSMIT